MADNYKKEGRKMVCQNRKARHDYDIIETFEAGMSLQGSEVKSLRLGGAQLVDSYAEVTGGEVFLVGAQIAQYACSSYQNHEPRRRRKLLMHRREIDRTWERIQPYLTWHPAASVSRH